ncbi:MAG: methylated-DNA--[protein]-cysteine S-methyltransferase [Candidatus Babeliales bacterium]
MQTNKKVQLFTSQEFKKYIKNKQIYKQVVSTPAGLLEVQATKDGVFQAAFVDQTTLHIEAMLKCDTVLLVGTPFQQHVWQEALAISAGTTLSYHDLAHKIGKPSAFRAVANALGANNISYIVPCHRIKRKNGDLGGYAWGLDRKQALLAYEAVKTT